MSIFDTGSSKTKVMVKDVGNGKEEMGIGKQETIIMEEGIVEEGHKEEVCQQGGSDHEHPGGCHKGGGSRH